MIIHKYVIEPSTRYVLNLPKNSEILSVQNQRETLCVWVKIQDSKELRKEVHRLRIFMTGDEEDAQGMVFISTVQMSAGALVLHIFEEL